MDINELNNAKVHDPEREEGKPYAFYRKRCGNTTRLADWYIQKLFVTGDTGVIKDHYGNQVATDLLHDILMQRLTLEHHIPNDSFEIVSKNRIKLTKVYFENILYNQL